MSRFSLAVLQPVLSKPEPLRKVRVQTREGSVVLGVFNMEMLGNPSSVANIHERALEGMGLRGCSDEAARRFIEADGVQRGEWLHIIMRTYDVHHRRQAQSLWWLRRAQKKSVSGLSGLCDFLPGSKLVFEIIEEGS